MGPPLVVSSLLLSFLVTPHYKVECISIKQTEVQKINTFFRATADVSSYFFSDWTIFHTRDIQILFPRGHAFVSYGVLSRLHICILNNIDRILATLGTYVVFLCAPLDLVFSQTWLYMSHTHSGSLANPANNPLFLDFHHGHAKRDCVDAFFVWILLHTAHR